MINLRLRYSASCKSWHSPVSGFHSVQSPIVPGGLNSVGRGRTGPIPVAFIPITVIKRPAAGVKGVVDVSGFYQFSFMRLAASVDSNQAARLECLNPTLWNVHRRGISAVCAVGIFGQAVRPTSKTFCRFRAHNPVSPGKSGAQTEPFYVPAAFVEQILGQAEAAIDTIVNHNYVGDGLAYARVRKQGDVGMSGINVLGRDASSPWPAGRAVPRRLPFGLPNRRTSRLRF